MPNGALTSIDPNIYNMYVSTTTVIHQLSRPATPSSTDYRHQQSIINSMENLNPTSITPVSENWKQLCLDTLSELEQVHTTSSGLDINNNLHFRGRECVIVYMEFRHPEQLTQVAQKWRHLYYDAIREFEQTVGSRTHPGADAAYLRELEARDIHNYNHLHDVLAQLQQCTDEVVTVRDELDRVRNRLDQVRQDKVNEKWRADRYLRKVQRLKEEGNREVTRYLAGLNGAQRQAEVEKTRQRFKQQARQSYYDALKLEVAAIDAQEMAPLKARIQCVLQLMEENDPAV